MIWKIICQNIPIGARRIWEIGCANGDMGLTLKQREGSQDCYIAGIEISKKLAEEAMTKLDMVFAADAETFDFGIFVDPFDTIIFGDSLEHMRDPSRLLDRLAPHLSNNGMLIASFPNARNLYLIDSLLHGDWCYTSWGLLDKTHYHLFTLKSMLTMLSQKMLVVEKWFYVTHPLQWFERMASPQTLNPVFVERYSTILSVMAEKNDPLPYLRKWFPGIDFKEEDTLQMVSAQIVVVARKQQETDKTLRG